MEITLLLLWIFKETDVPTYFHTVSLAVWQRVTMEKGQTLTLKCPITNARKNHAEWKNPDGYIMFFNNNRGEHDRSCASITSTHV